MTAGAPCLHSLDSRISWRVKPFGIASDAATVSVLWELSRETLTGLDQFIHCHLGSSNRSRHRLSLCASRVYCKQAMRCHQPGFTVQRVIFRQVLCCVVLQHLNNNGQLKLNSLIGYLDLIRLKFFNSVLLHNFKGLMCSTIFGQRSTECMLHVATWSCWMSARLVMCHCESSRSSVPCILQVTAVHQHIPLISIVSLN